MHRGAAEIAGMPGDVMEHVSQRRLEIRSALENPGAGSACAARVAALETRRAKDYGADVTLTSEYVAGQRHGRPNVDHGYAVTAHGLQGGTLRQRDVPTRPGRSFPARDR